MSVLMEFAIFPTDKGESVSPYVARVLRVVKESGYPHQLTAMGTIVETERFEEATRLLEAAYRVLEPDSGGQVRRAQRPSGAPPGESPVGRRKSA